MTPDIAAILVVDGVAAGAIYVLVALGLVLIFTVTRVVFVPFGDIAAFTALTLAALNEKRLPGTAGLVAALAVIATLVELSALARAGRWVAAPRAEKIAKPGTPEFHAALHEALFSVENLAGTQGLYNFTPDSSYGVGENALVLMRLVDGKWKYEP